MVLASIFGRQSLRLLVVVVGLANKQQTKRRLLVIVVVSVVPIIISSSDGSVLPSPRVNESFPLTSTANDVPRWLLMLMDRTH